MSAPNNGGPAFPTTKPLDYWGDPNGGMTLRDWFAWQALAGGLADRDIFAPDESVARDAYIFFDAMLPSGSASHECP